MIRLQDSASVNQVLLVHSVMSVGMLTMGFQAVAAGIHSQSFITYIPSVVSALSSSAFVNISSSLALNPWLLTLLLL